MTPFTPWPAPDERARVLVTARRRAVGSRVAGTVRVPHPAPPGAPGTVPIKARYPLPTEATEQGRVSGPDWVDEDCVGWWAEAADPRQDAALVADALAVGCGEIGFAVTDRRVSVVFPHRLLAASAAAQAETRRSKGLLSRALGSVGDLLDSAEWVAGDALVALWEADARRVRGWTRTTAGRGFPFADLLRVDFRDGSTLFARVEPTDLVEENRPGPA